MSTASVNEWPAPATRRVCPLSAARSTAVTTSARLLGASNEAGLHDWSPAQLRHSVIASTLPALAPRTGTVMAIAGGVLGAFAGGALRARPEVSGTRRAIVLAGISLLAVGATTGYLLHTTEPKARVIVRLHETGGQERVANATVRVEPAYAARDADWLTVTAWQGGERLHVDRLEPVGAGVYRTTKPMPVDGD